LTKILFTSIKNVLFKKNCYYKMKMFWLCHICHNQNICHWFYLFYHVFVLRYHGATRASLTLPW